jgi:hypothetical protein
MVPVMGFRCSDEPPKGADRQTDIGVNVDDPNPTEGHEPGQHSEGNPEEETRQVDQGHGVGRVEGMLPVGRQPIKVFGAVVNGMETPKEWPPRLQAVSPIDAKVAQARRKENQARARTNDDLEPGRTSGWEPGTTAGAIAWPVVVFTPAAVSPFLELCQT